MSVVLSIIIPVFNTEEYLKNCIDSLPANNNEIEIIIIDDASYKKITKKILYSQKKNKKIKIIKNKKNIGVGNSRNKGIKKAIGKYLLFLDSDDKIERSNLSSLISYLKIINKDLIYCRFKKKTFPNDNITILRKLRKYNKISHFKNAIIKSEFMGDDCWPFIVKREFILKNNILFPKNIRVAEDEYFNAKLFLNINSFGVFDKNFYIHNEREGSLSSDLSSFNNNVDFIKLFYLFIALLSSSKLKKNDKQIIFRYLRILYSRIMFLMLIRSTKEKKMICKEIILNNSKKYKKILIINNLFYLSDILNITNFSMFAKIEKNFSKKIIYKTKYYDNVFIYCRTLIAKGLNKIISSNKKKVICFIDDANLKEKKFEKKKVIKFKDFLRIIKKYQNNYIVFIANNRTSTYKKIKNKLTTNKILSSKVKQIF